MEYNKKKALVGGITGQDGSILADFLLAKGYKVLGLQRRTSTLNTQNIKHLLDNQNFELVSGDLTDFASLLAIFQNNDIDECYHLAAQSHVKLSFSEPISTIQINALGTVNILEALRKGSPNTKLYFAATSEMWGNSFEYHEDGSGKKIQNEETPFAPRSPYAAAKLCGFWLCQMYKEAYGLFICSGILHNHDSTRRGENFLTRKVTKYISGLYHYLKEQEHNYNKELGVVDLLGKHYPKLKLGNLNSIRDFSHAKDMVKAMWMILQQDTPDDYVVSSDLGHSVEDFVRAAFSHVGLNWRDFVEIDPTLFRECEVNHLAGDSRKIRTKLGWEPEYSFDTLVQEMVDYDITSLGPVTKSRCCQNA